EFHNQFTLAILKERWLKEERLSFLTGPQSTDPTPIKNLWDEID
ncbi:21432_t:CDS:1, partial [Gigaspora rosea]